MYKKITYLLLISLFILGSGFGCKTTDSQTEEAMQAITLNYWRVFDGPDAFSDIIANYKVIHPNITINYRKLRYEEYEDALLNALAEDRGPDILSIHNTWIKKYENKLAPMPSAITLAYQEETGAIKKETINVLRTYNTPSLKNIKDNFVDTVFNDVVLNTNEIYGLPLSVDTLALYYNRDLFNNAGITQAPLYWNTDFQQNIKKLTKQDPVQGITQSGIALGGDTNITRFSDILSVLMMQNGATMLENNQVLFNAIPAATKSTNYNPGLEALRFYIDFANPGKEVYSWNDDMPNSLDMFINGKLAMMFGYSYQLADIKAGAPKLNFSISKLPQIENSPLEINFANYWVEGVSKKSLYQNEAWDFIIFATKAEQVKSYLEVSKKPTALRSLIEAQKEDDDIGIFVDQLLTAKSWYKGIDPNAAETAIGEMISKAREGSEKILDILNTGASKVQQTIN